MILVDRMGTNLTYALNVSMMLVFYSLSKLARSRINFAKS